MEVWVDGRVAMTDRQAGRHACRQADRWMARDLAAHSESSEQTV